MVLAATLLNLRCHRSGASESRDVGASWRCTTRQPRPSDPTASPTAYIAIDPFLIDFATLKGANPGATDVDVAMDGFTADDPNAPVLTNGYAQITDDGVTLHVTLSGNAVVCDVRRRLLLRLLTHRLTHRHDRSAA